MLIVAAFSIAAAFAVTAVLSITAASAARGRLAREPQAVVSQRGPDILAPGAVVQAASTAGAESAPKHPSGKVHYDILAKLLADDRRAHDPTKWLCELAALPAAQHASENHPLLGHAAPQFKLVDLSGACWALEEKLASGPVVLVFYLGYSCNACVHNLFELNADLDRWRALGAEVVAVSGDTYDITRRQYERYGSFGYSLLSDADHAVAQAYGVYSPAVDTDPECVLHGTFVIARDGKVHWVSTGDSPFQDNKTLLYELALLENKLPSGQVARSESEQVP